MTGALAVAGGAEDTDAAAPARSFLNLAGVLEGQSQAPNHRQDAPAPALPRLLAMRKARYRECRHWW